MKGKLYTISYYSRGAKHYFTLSGVYKNNNDVISMFESTLYGACGYQYAISNVKIVKVSALL